VKKEERHYLHFLDDIVLSMQRIEEYISGMDFSSFKKDYKTVDAVIRNFEIIGEAVRNLPDSIKSAYPDLPWEQMYRLRNRVAHEYFGIDYVILWDIAKNYLPENKKAIERIIVELKKSK
jgi:uncharacterized protein with HEPN domain